MIRTSSTPFPPSGGPPRANPSDPPPTEHEIRGMIARCFTPPEIEPARPTGHQPVEQSVLHLLRREAQLCLFGSISPESEALLRLEQLDPNSFHLPLFAATMVLFAGIDLLGKFVNDVSSKKRFTEFAKAYQFVPDKNQQVAEELYEFRCALMHNFGLVDDKGKKPLFLDLTPHQVDPEPFPIVIDEASRWRVDVAQLYRRFVAAVGKYQDDLGRANTECALYQNFATVYPQFGRIFVGSEQ